MSGGPLDLDSRSRVKREYLRKLAFVYEHGSPEQWECLAGTIDMYVGALQVKTALAEKLADLQPRPAIAKAHLRLIHSRATK
jgi:hypothetical protein